jgi:cyclophilin family peptidyl-prolyl cis-trans isomerase
VKHRITRLSVLLNLALFSAAIGQEITPAPSPAPVLPPLERLANDAQQALFNAADRAAGPKTNVAPNGGQVTTTSRKATFSAPKLEDPSTWKKDSRHKLAIMTVSFGGNVEEVMFELYPQDAPMTVSNFLDNVETGAYNGLAFHRAIQGFIVQTGDPLTSDEAARERWGTGGEGKTVLAEIKRTHRKGAVAMGRKSDKTNPGKKSNGYQFYFALGNYASLDNNYTVFAQVVSGIDVLERISKMPVDSNDCPIARIEVKSIKINDHKGPLYVSTQNDGDAPKYSKPSSARGPFGRFLNSVW